MRKRFFRAATLSIAVGLVIAFLFAVPLMEQIYTDETQQRLETALSLAEGYATADGYQALAARVGSRAAPCWGTAWPIPPGWAITASGRRFLTPWPREPAGISGEARPPASGRCTWPGR